MPPPRLRCELSGPGCSCASCNTGSPAVVPEQGRGLAPVGAAALAAAQANAREALAPETLRAYAADWAHFCCAPLAAEPAAVAAYLASLAGLYSRSLLERRLASIGQQHRLRGLDWSARHPAIPGIYRRHGSRSRQAAALTFAELRRLVAACGGDQAGLCDHALLLLGFACALRRSKLIGIDRGHLRCTGDEIRLRLVGEAVVLR